MRRADHSFRGVPPGVCVCQYGSGDVHLKLLRQFNFDKRPSNSAPILRETLLECDIFFPPRNTGTLHKILTSLRSTS
jgi:hypothetical protein